MSTSIRAFLLLLGIAAFGLASQEEGAELPLEAPKDWGGETIKLPPPFAPGMKFRGVEKIRFAPGMFRKDSDSFFSYVFVFRVGVGQDLSLKALREEILVYYRGLAKAVGRGTIDTTNFSLKLEKLKAAAGFDAFTGRLQWVEPFVTKQPQTLHLELHAWKGKAGKHRYLFCSASPAAPGAAIWKEMRGVRRKFEKAVPPAPDDSGSTNWPSFRGPGASGVADGQKLPDRWGGEEDLNIRWKRKIPGLAHSSPVIWGNRIFVTSAISSKGNASFRPGLYGDGDASEDRSSHRWVLTCLDKMTGKLLWENVATEGVPREKRHIKATYANSTPATDGRTVVAFFGSQGLFAFDMDGGKKWEKDLGRLDAGAYNARHYEWGTASSPILYRDLVIVQCDTQEESFILGADLETGKTRWKTVRDELPSWGTPTVCEGPKGPELVTNASKFIRGYDPLTGKELWRLGGSSKITAPTPVFDGDLMIVASGRSPERPIFAIRAGSRGDLTLPKGSRSSERIAWSRVRRGPYMPTPLIYRGHLYMLHNNGIFDCYEVKTGKEVYRQRIRHGGSGFSASPVAADGKIYLPSEDGDIFVVRAGREFELIAQNSVGEHLMATPALSEGTLYVRARHHLLAIGS